MGKFVSPTPPPKHYFLLKFKLFSDSSLLWGFPCLRMCFFLWHFSQQTPKKKKAEKNHLLSENLSLNSPFVTTDMFHKTHFRRTQSCHIPGFQLSVSIWKIQLKAEFTEPRRGEESASTVGKNKKSSWFSDIFYFLSKALPKPGVSVNFSIIS